MSELKAYIAPTPDGTGLADYYLKSEVASGPIYANIKFCPMCGRKLVEESDAEG